MKKASCLFIFAVTIASSSFGMERLIGRIKTTLASRHYKTILNDESKEVSFSEPPCADSTREDVVQEEQDGEYPQFNFKQILAHKVQSLDHLNPLRDQIIAKFKDSENLHSYLETNNVPVEILWFDSKRKPSTLELALSLKKVKFANALIEYLIEKNAVSSCDDRGQNALLLTIKFDQETLLNSLLKLPANIAHIDNTNSAIIKTLKYDSWRFTEKILTKDSSQYFVTVGKHRHNLVTFACRYSSYETLKALLDRMHKDFHQMTDGAVRKQIASLMNKPNTKWGTPLDIAILKPDAKKIRLLLKYGAKTNVDYSTSLKKGSEEDKLILHMLSHLKQKYYFE